MRWTLGSALLAVGLLILAYVLVNTSILLGSTWPIGCYDPVAIVLFLVAAAAGATALSSAVFVLSDRRWPGERNLGRGIGCVWAAVALTACWAVFLQPPCPFVFPR
jgi:hypothetical protein